MAKRCQLNLNYIMISKEAWLSRASFCIKKTAMSIAVLSYSFRK